MRQLFLTVFLTVAAISSGQNLKEMLEADSAVWYGLDFSRAKLMGDFSHPSAAGVKDGVLIVERWIPEWNALVLKEAWNFDVGAAIQKPKTRKEIASVMKLNAVINPDSIFSAEPIAYKFKNPEEQIGAMIKNYSDEKFRSGLGCVFIVESFNKKAVNANVYFVLFDIGSKKLIGYKRLMGTPKGGGIRNYWAGAIKDIIEQVKVSAYGGVKWNAMKSK